MNWFDCKYVRINVPVKIWFLITAARFEVKRRQGIEFVSIVSDDSDDCRNVIFFEQSVICLQVTVDYFQN